MPITSVLCLCSGLAPWCPSELFAFLFPLFSTWCSVFRLYVFLLVSMWELWRSDCCDPFSARVQSNSTSSVAPLHSISVSVLFLAIHHWRWCMASVSSKSCDGTWIGTHLFSCCLLPSFFTSGCGRVTTGWTSELNSRIRIWTMNNRNWLEMMGFHPNRHLAKDKKHRCRNNPNSRRMVGQLWHWVTSLH